MPVKYNIVECKNLF